MSVNCVVVSYTCRLIVCIYGKIMVIVWVIYRSYTGPSPGPMPGPMPGPSPSILVINWVMVDYAYGLRSKYF